MNNIRNKIKVTISNEDLSKWTDDEVQNLYLDILKNILKYEERINLTKKK